MNYYDWVPFFKKICREIKQISNKPNRDFLLFQKAQATFNSTDAILKFDYVDPFSYLYALAQRNTPNQFDSYFTRAKNAWGIEVEIPTDYIFPTPQPNSLSLFYNTGIYRNGSGEEIGSSCIWSLFGQIFSDQDVSNEDFQSVLSLKNVGTIKLTQVMFLVNPDEYIPFDTRMNSLLIPELENLRVIVAEIETLGIKAYNKVINLLKTAFPGCKMYEINLLNWLVNSSTEDTLKITNSYCQISSNADGKTEGDFYDKFIETNTVWTGGPTSLNGKQVYPLADFYRGDVVLVRRGTVRLGGIGIILDNEYITNGWSNESAINVLWLIKNTRPIKEDRLGQGTGFDRATDKTLSLFKEVYPETFALLDNIRQKQRTMIDHNVNTQKNVILYGPPGTGKTRKALQIAKWLVRGLDHSLNLMGAIDKDNFTETPDITGIDEIKLVQFHPSYTYEDFVRGIVTSVQGEKIIYDVENKVIAEMAGIAALPENSNKAFVLIIDEINRANLSAVLGELIYALEYRDHAVETLYKYHNSNRLTLPNNLYIIGTMNTADRSVGHIDYAIRRRFSFIPVLPDAEAIKEPIAKTLFNTISELFDDYTAPDFSPDDVRIGHSYFLCKKDELKLRLKYDIKPILLEYLRDGILLSAAEQVINDLNV